MTVGVGGKGPMCAPEKPVDVWKSVTGRMGNPKKLLNISPTIIASIEPGIRVFPSILRGFFPSTVRANELNFFGTSECALG